MRAVASAERCSARGEIGTPCSDDDECSGELICDIHGDKGTCQDDHGHRVMPEGELGPADVIVEG